MDFLSYSPTNLNQSFDLVKYYKTKNEASYYLLPLLGLSVFDFREFFVDTYIDMKEPHIYVKTTNPMYSCCNDTNMITCFHTSSDDDEEYYFLQFEIPDEYYKYYQYFKENKLTQFSPVAAKILLKAGLLYNTRGVQEFDTYRQCTPEQEKLNRTKELMILSLYHPLSMIDGEMIKTKLYEDRLQIMLNNNIMTEEEFLSKVVEGSMDLSEHIDMNKHDIEEQLKVYKHVSKYNHNPFYAY